MCFLLFFWASSKGYDFSDDGFHGTSRINSAEELKFE